MVGCCLYLLGLGGWIDFVCSLLLVLGGLFECCVWCWVLFWNYWMDVYCFDVVVLNLV